MAYTKYSLTPANNNATPPDGAPEGMLPSAVNDTMRDMMAQIRDVGDGIRDGTYTMTAAKITGGTITGATINNSAIGGTTAAAGKFTTLEATGVTTVQAGTVSAPAITTSGDTNTGIFFPAADTIAFTEGGAEAMRIDSSGNVGIGVTPSAWRTAGGEKVLQIDTGSVYCNSVNDVYLNRNWFLNSSASTIYIESDFASSYGQVSGNHIWYTAPSGTAGNAFTLTERMRIDSSGNLLLGTTSASLSGITSSISRNGGSGFNAINSNTGTATYANFQLGNGNGANRGGVALLGSAWTTSGIFIQDGVYVYSAGNGGLTLAAETASPIYFATNNTERMRITSGGDVGIGVSSPAAKLHVSGTYGTTATGGVRLVGIGQTTGDLSPIAFYLQSSNWGTAHQATITAQQVSGTDGGSNLLFGTSASGGSAPSERMRITSGGDFLVGRTSGGLNGTSGTTVQSDGRLLLEVQSQDCIIMNRQASDGNLVTFRQANTDEGSISVSGTTVSYNGGHLARYAQTVAPKDESLLKGTVLSNLDEMNEYVDADSNPVDNEQLNKVKVSDVEGDVNVAGVFVNWSFDKQHNVDEINMAMTGDMIIRIAQGVVVQKGDLLMSAGNGTAKPQGDDIVRSKTIAKVTSNHVTCTYADGSYCVPCVLMAC